MILDKLQLLQIRCECDYIVNLEPKNYDYKWWFLTDTDYDGILLVVEYLCPHCGEWYKTDLIKQQGLLA